MKPEFLSYADTVKGEIRSFLEKSKHDLKFAIPEVVDLLSDYASSGKAIRGSLVLYSHSIFGGSRFDEALKAAVSIELLHSGILIADDVIDRDTIRRGLPTLHISLANRYLRSESKADVKGEDLAICVSLFATYLGGSLLSDISPSCAKLIMENFAVTSLAEIAELELTIKETFSLDEVLKVYGLKTGHYSISLPLLAGALLAGKDELVEVIDEAGIKAGIAFQIKDDLIEITFTEKETGKDRFSDFRAGRKTAAAALLFESADKEEYRKLKNIFLQGGAKTESEIQLIEGLIKKYGIEEKLEELINIYSNEAIVFASRDNTLEKIIIEIVEFNRARNA